MLIVKSLAIKVSLCGPMYNIKVNYKYFVTAHQDQ